VIMEERSSESSSAQGRIGPFGLMAQRDGSHPIGIAFVLLYRRVGYTITDNDKSGILPAYINYPHQLSTTILG